MTNQLDLFQDAYTAPGYIDYQLRLRHAMQKQWDEDLRIIQDRGDIPPWLELDSLLQRDEAAILTLAADTGYIPYGGRHTRLLADQLGYESTGNLKASVNSCLTKKLISIRWNDAQSCMLIRCTAYGMFLLELWEDEE